MNTRAFSTAIHEASHAVASLHLLAKPLGCRLFVEGEQVGGVACEQPEQASPTRETDPRPEVQTLCFGIDQQAVIREAITDACGYAGQAELAGDDSPRIRHEEITPDLLRVKAALMAIDPEATESETFLFEELAFSMARRFCRKHRGVILQIAGQLVERRTLSQADVLRIIYPRVMITD
jgi:hypothetical protein